MTYQSLAFFTGLLGSLHCIAMCGPLIMAIPFQGSPWLSTVRKLVYQLGRILTYSVMGFLAGSLGGLFNILGLQEILSLVSGIVLIIIAVLHFSERKKLCSDKLYQKIFGPIAAFMGKWMSKPYGGLFAGMLHGLIPCGMVYMAIAGSLNTGSAWTGSSFMFFFGLGTTPLLLFASFMPGLLRRFISPRLMIPVLFFIAGTFLIARSVNLHIPYLPEPVNRHTEAAVC